MINNQSVLNPIALTFVALMAIILFRVSRQYAMLPIIAVALYLTQNLRVVTAGFDFTMLRLILIFAWIRVVIRSETNLINLNLIDKILIFKVILGTLTYTILWGTISAFVNRLGHAYDIIGLYFISRILIRDLNDIERLFKALLIMSIPIAITMVAEQITGRNIFSIFGGVPEYSMIRDGRIRAQGTFAHAILAGAFGASLLPLFVGLWLRNRIKKTAFIFGIFTASTMVATSNSSGPYVAYLAGIVGLCFWVYRNHIRIIFWGTIAGLAFLHLYMKAPVWALIMRFGSSGSYYHRYQIIDQTIRHFNEWWLIGTQSTIHWGHLKTIHDVANFYCRTAIDYGLIGLLLFVLIFSLCFKAVGKTVRQITDQPELQKFIWAIGASLFVHAIVFIGVSYTGTNILILYVTFAILSTVSVMKFEHNTTTKLKIIYR